MALKGWVVYREMFFDRCCRKKYMCFFVNESKAIECYQEYRKKYQSEAGMDEIEIIE